MSDLEQEVGQLLREKGLKLCTVESATGGLISHRLTNVHGSSDFYLGSIVSYSNDVKKKVAGVKDETLKEHGAVSPEVAKEMAEGGRRALDADICIADTGIAGPGGATPTKPVGLFYLGLSHKSGTFARKHISSGDREQNKKSAADAVLSWLKEFLQNIDSKKQN
jgi:PncC family amidohydrolase